MHKGHVFGSALKFALLEVYFQCVVQPKYEDQNCICDTSRKDLHKRSLSSKLEYKPAFKQIPICRPLFPGQPG